MKIIAKFPAILWMSFAVAACGSTGDSDTKLELSVQNPGNGITDIAGGNQPKLVWECNDKYDHGLSVKLVQDQSDKWSVTVRYADLVPANRKEFVFVDLVESTESGLTPVLFLEGESESSQASFKMFINYDGHNNPLGGRIDMANDGEAVSRDLNCRKAP